MQSTYTFAVTTVAVVTARQALANYNHLRLATEEFYPQERTHLNSTIMVYSNIASIQLWLQLQLNFIAISSTFVC